MIRVFAALALTYAAINAGSHHAWAAFAITSILLLGTMLSIVVKDGE